MPEVSGLYYFAHGLDNYIRPPLILIHGAGGHHLVWPPEVRRLPGDRVFALDLPGHGKSAGVGCQSIADYAEAVALWMNAMGLTSAVLAGHSMGAAIALHIAANLPERVLGLCIFGGGARLPVASDLLQGTADPDLAPATIDQMIDLSFGRSTPARLKELARARMRDTRSALLHGDLLACCSVDLSAEVSRLKLPALLMCGDEDRMTPPALTRFLAAQMSGSRMELVASAGHMIMLERPQLVADKIASFLDLI